MKFSVFTLHPQIFESFLGASLLARGISQKIVQVDLINWREKYGVGGYKQVDDRPFGGGSGMVLQADPIFKALKDHGALSFLSKQPDSLIAHQRIEPPNADFVDFCQVYKPDSVTISLTPRGFLFNQQIAEWLTGFKKVNLLCGRYEGFDARVSEVVDLEISLGNFVLNGGEVAAMAMIESVARLIPGFVTKGESVLHDSFSRGLNYYPEQREFVVGAKKIGMNPDFGSLDDIGLDPKRLFDNQWWRENILPQLEHPHYTRPEVWRNYQVPDVLLSGDHKAIQNWRQNWWRELV